MNRGKLSIAPGGPAPDQSTETVAEMKDKGIKTVETKETNVSKQDNETKHGIDNTAGSGSEPEAEESSGADLQSLEVYTFTITGEEAGLRTDVFLTREIPDISRSYIKKLIEGDFLTVNGKRAKAALKLKTGDQVVFTLKPEETISASPENIPLDIIYQDQWVAVLDKPPGMVVHPAAGSLKGTLVNALLYHVKDLSGINGMIRPGIVHRIDKDTSGILVVAKNDPAHRGLSAQLADHSMVREYFALCEGIVKNDTGTIETKIGRDPNNRLKMAVTRDGRRAVTHYKVLARYKQTTLLKLSLETGRTHQIRVHLAHINHPVCGDPVYGWKKQRIKLNGQLLHAGKLGFIHPGTGRYMEFRRPVHEEFRYVLMKQYKET